MKYAPLLRAFLKQAKTTNQRRSDYVVSENGVTAKASFGQGAQARIPWISFTKEGHVPTNGIYPVYLYFKSHELLLLAYGVSETNIPNVHWSIDEVETIAEYFNRNNYKKPDRYGASYVFKVYDPLHLPTNEELDKDLNEIIDVYHQSTTNQQPKIEPTKTRGKRKMKPFDLTSFQNSLRKSNLIFSDQLVARYTASLLTKPFVILTGLSGSGKTQLAKSFARWIAQSDDQVCIVPVGADWTNRDPLLGYPNGLKNTEYVLPETGVLQLLLRAVDNPQQPYFLILDEMNLSHVERYFSDFLSGMESRSPILLHDLNNKMVPKQINLPVNVFITGTVNIDETTYMFSPKVLDRANVIEFRIEYDEMLQFLQAPLKPSPIENMGKEMGENFVLLAQQEVTEKPDESLIKVLRFFDQLQQAGSEFGYRTASDIHRLLYYLGKLGIHDGDEQLDIALIQKLLPKLHGSRRKLIPILEKMAEGCIDSSQHNVIKEYLDTGNFDQAVLQPITMGKLHRMYRSAIENGFASYAEA